MPTPSTSLKDVTPDVLASLLGQLTQGQLSQLPHSLLSSTRSRVPTPQQNQIAPAEHRAFAREVVTENPLMAAPLAVAIPAYQVYKLLSKAIGTEDAMDPTTSDPSMAQITQGFAGVGEGLSTTLDNLLK